MKITVEEILNKLKSKDGRKEVEQLLKKLPDIRINIRKYTKGNKLLPIVFYDKLLHKLIFYYYTEDSEKQFQHFILDEYGIVVSREEIKEVREYTMVSLPKPQEDKNITEKLLENINNLEKSGLISDEIYERMVNLYLNSKKIEDKKEEKQPIKIILEKIIEVEGDDQ